MDLLEEIRLKVLESIRPKPHERELLLRTFNIIKTRIETYFKEKGLEVEATLQGSVAHDTWLSGDRDIDVFVLFPKDIGLNELKTNIFKQLVESVSGIGEVKLRYAEHPYIRLLVNGVEADIVPAYRLSNVKEIKTAVDRTPFHTEFINSRLNDRLRDDVRLLKKFMKTINVYGAEIKTKGFSGYAVELLVVTYGGFIEVLRNASRWRIPVFIQSVNMGKEELKHLKEKYPDSLIFMPDPVDPGRNTTANVSRRNLVKFIVASNCFLNNPSLRFFQENHISYDEKLIETRLINSCITLIGFLTRDLPPETIWGEAQRVADRMVKLLRHLDFNVIDYDVWSDEVEKVLIAVELDECVKPIYKLYRGPPYRVESRVMDFIKKHIERGHVGPWIGVNGELYALASRKYVNALDALEARRSDYLVAPHLKNIWFKTRVEAGVLTKVKEVDEKAYNWLIKFIVKREPWMDLCTA